MGTGVILVVTIVASYGSPTVSKPVETKENDSGGPLEQPRKLPEIAELEDLKNHVDVLFIPALQVLYFKNTTEVKYSTGKKMRSIRGKLKRAETPLLTKHVTLQYLEKYQRHIKDLKNFELITDVDVLESTMYKRQLLWKYLHDQLNLAVTELFESIQRDVQQSNDEPRIIKKVKKTLLRRNGNSTGKLGKKPLLKLNAYGDFTYMTTYDIYLLNHLSGFLEYSIKELNRKRHQERRE